MSGLAKWSPGSPVTVLSTELNSLTTNNISSASSAISNDTNLDIYVDVEFFYTTSAGAAGTVGIYILEAIDGTNYPSFAAADLRLSWSHLLCSIFVGSATTQRAVARYIAIPPGKFKIILDNQIAANFASSGNTLKFLPYNVNLNG